MLLLYWVLLYLSVCIALLAILDKDISFYCRIANSLSSFRLCYSLRNTLVLSGILVVSTFKYSYILNSLIITGIKCVFSAHYFSKWYPVGNLLISKCILTIKQLEARLCLFYGFLRFFLLVHVQNLYYLVEYTITIKTCTRDNVLIKLANHSRLRHKLICSTLAIARAVTFNIIYSISWCQSNYHWSHQIITPV